MKLRLSISPCPNDTFMFDAMLNGRIDCEGLEFHFIGTLQTNKVKYIIDKVKMIHSLDSLKLAAEIDKQAKKHNIVMDVLVEVNCGEEENKSGLMPSEVEAFCLALPKFSALRLRGFMTMAPKCEKKEDYLKYFQQLILIEHLFLNLLQFLNNHSLQ